jgi:thiol-disulfide isomerase/thioredoxin
MRQWGIPGARPAALALAALLAAAPLAAQAPSLGSKAPVVSVHDLDGASVDLGQWIGHRPVFLEFWATWCTSCQALEPTVRAAREAYGSQVEFLGINITVADPRDSVRAWVARTSPPWRTLYDDEGNSQRAYDVAETSYVVIIDRTGTIVYTGLGGAQSFSAALRRVTAQ